MMKRNLLVGTKIWGTKMLNGRIRWNGMKNVSNEAEESQDIDEWIGKEDRTKLYKDKISVNL